MQVSHHYQHNTKPYIDPSYPKPKCKSKKSTQSRQTSETPIFVSKRYVLMSERFTLSERLTLFVLLHTLLITDKVANTLLPPTHNQAIYRSHIVITLQ